LVLFESATTLHTLLGDHQNTVRDVIATNGTVENHLVYNSYGELKSQTGGGAYSPFHRFTGKPFDVAVGLQYNVNRWYDAVVGRWTSEDPIGFGGGHANLNIYTGNSPVNRVDPFGLEPVGLDPAERAAWRARRLAEMALIAQLNGPVRKGGDDWLDISANFAAGWGAVLSFNATNLIGEAAGIHDGIDKNGTAYNAGEWVGIIHTTAIGGALGARAAGTRGAGKEFSHWIPARWGGPRTILNGNYVTPIRHFKHDSWRWPRGWRNFGNRFPPVIQQLDRTPRIYVGIGSGLGYGLAGR
jgi:RHS repeat-associated protein